MKSKDSKKVQPRHTYRWKSIDSRVLCLHFRTQSLILLRHFLRDKTTNREVTTTIRIKHTVIKIKHIAIRIKHTLIRIKRTAIRIKHRVSNSVAWVSETLWRSLSWKKWIFSKWQRICLLTSQSRLISQLKKNLEK